MAKKQKTTETVMRFVVDGREFAFDVDAVTPKIAARVRKAVGLSPMGAVRAWADGDPDVDAMAAVACAAALQESDTADLDKVLALFEGYDGLDIDVVEEESDPET